MTIRAPVIGIHKELQQALAEWVEQIRPDYGPAGPALWPTERGGRISTDHINLRFAAYRDALGLPAELGPHCLRHSYITHLLEDGFDHLFVQQQAGHSWGSATAVYTPGAASCPGSCIHRLGRALADTERNRWQQPGSWDISGT